MNTRLGECPDARLSFQVANGTALSFQGKTFDFVFDKGTYDSIVSGPQSQKVATKLIAEIVRVLKPNGVYILVTCGRQKTRSFPQFFTQLAVETVGSYNIFILQKFKE
jgi:ubiquinone/menaquinone biosynthesis C-methylase UbiE